MSKMLVSQTKMECPCVVTLDPAHVEFLKTIYMNFDLDYPTILASLAIAHINVLRYRKMTEENPALVPAELRQALDQNQPAASEPAQMQSATLAAHRPPGVEDRSEEAPNPT